MSHTFVSRAMPAVVLFLAVALSSAQEVHQWTERENSGFKGPVRSARTNVTRPNADPRPGRLHKLFLDGHPDWVVFDSAGRQIEFASAASGETIVSVKCTFQPDDSRVCEDSKGQQHESKEQRSTLPDGSREVTYIGDSKVESRVVTRFDEQGEAVSTRIYGSDGKLITEERIQPAGYERKFFDDDGTVLEDLRSLSPDTSNRIENQFYDSVGNLTASVAISIDGEMLSHWYSIGLKPKVSSSDSISTCRPRVCVAYTFDEEGSGRLEKLVQHSQGVGNVEPDREEHYNFDGVLDERAEIAYVRDSHGNWTSRSVFVWDLRSNLRVEIERDTRVLEYY